ncbi:hypothetical protein HS088_TW18G00494 [Tripterygium wilfordii]|uniref:Multidrug resistance protein n=1 Tax=Tripterygium wilfordii TaxID=458696 RepID=A0A7J7CCF5_TRIWF|nr:uncharacterized protein LOC119984331 [Tripterygium wilfordii]XP_038684144.1 uncharacterized protein LOC119984331 [Tripterygium wilfordii]KAF5731809.1 hypothetical protein HS088_TW18G00494 [Tripterygium wilfordii]
MNELDSERSTSTQWNTYTNLDPSPSQTGAPWKSFGNSMNAISFGFVATAILISMFLIMAIFEHLFRPNPSFSSPQEVRNTSPESGVPPQKLGDLQTAPTSHASDFSVVMPGQQYPSYIAQPAPLPCPREGICRPSHEHNIVGLC